MAQERWDAVKEWATGQRGKFNHRVTMEGLLSQARQSFEVFVNSGNMIDVEKKISDKLMRYAYGIILLTEVNAGFLMGGGKVGTGIIVTRLTTNRWSAPIAVGHAGLSFGPQLGASKVDHVIILPSPESLESFLGKGQISIKGNTQLTVGNIGRDAQVGVAVSVEGKLAPVTSYSFGAKGLYGGLSIGSIVLAPRTACNKAFYGYDINLKDITSGQIEAPLLNEDYKRIVELLNVHQKLNENHVINAVDDADPFMAAMDEQRERYSHLKPGDESAFEYQLFDATK